jgi:hypothetical protein
MRSPVIDADLKSAHQLVGIMNEVDRKHDSGALLAKLTYSYPQAVKSPLRPGLRSCSARWVK